MILATAISLVACATAKDSVGGGDSRLDDSTQPEKPVIAGGSRVECGPEAKGDLVLLDARTAGPLTCTPVTVTAEPMNCEANCSSDKVFEGRTNKRGQIVAAGAFSNARLVAVADGYSPSYLRGASLSAGKILELEMAPAEGFWLKVIDAEGNYLQDVAVTFKQGADVIASLRTNELANVFFPQRNPFSGDPVSVEATGYQNLTIAGLAELGDDGHTLTLKK
jgi:hypothetical protein